MDIIEACKKGDIKRVKELLEQGADPTVDNNDPIKWASRYGHANVVEVLLQDGRADPTDNENAALALSIFFAYIKVVDALLKDGRVDPTDRDNWALWHSSMVGDVKLVELLLQDGRVEATDRAIREAKTAEIREMLIRYKYRVDGQEYQNLKNDLSTLNR